MKMWGRKKEPKALASREDTGRVGGSQVSANTDNNTPRIEEACGLFVLHDLPRDSGNALECVLICTLKR